MNETCDFKLQGTDSNHALYLGISSI